MKEYLKGSGVEYKRVGKLLGSGIEGSVYEYGRGRVIKVVARTHGESYESRVRVYEALRLRRRVAAIFNWGRLSGRDGWWVEMERLYPLKAEERKLINNGGYRWVDNKYVKVRDREDVRLFFNWLERLRRRGGLDYVDVHGGNVMKGAGGELKVCDLDGFRVCNLG